MPESLETITLWVHPDLPSADARRSLASWLRSEDRLREKVAAANGPTAPPDQQAADVADGLLVATDGGGDVMVLVQAVAGWLTHRRDDVTVRLARADGWSAELDVRGARDMGQVTALIEAALRGSAE
ncbi:effector-associated constant component EACC1 [Micromonospora vulcania]|uniref:Uncharacterized protein n=1 Tax=Micromonospora vulcania TaxID=1441873 RepID=A0ABW1H0Z6_9ACTN